MIINAVLSKWKSGINHYFLYFITKNIYLKRYILANIIIVLLFPIGEICRSENRGDWEKKNNGALIRGVESTNTKSSLLGFYNKT
jgi:hypothetical protein